MSDTIIARGVSRSPAWGWECGVDWLDWGLGVNVSLFRVGRFYACLRLGPVFLDVVWRDLRIMEEYTDVYIPVRGNDDGDAAP
jgi:hypothetical protein